MINSQFATLAMTASLVIVGPSWAQEETDALSQSFGDRPRKTLVNCAFAHFG